MIYNVALVSGVRKFPFIYAFFFLISKPCIRFLFLFGPPQYEVWIRIKIWPIEFWFKKLVMCDKFSLYVSFFKKQQFKSEAYQQQIEMERLNHQAELLLKKVTEESDKHTVQDPLMELKLIWDSLDERIINRQVNTNFKVIY